MGRADCRRRRTYREIGLGLPLAQPWRCRPRPPALLLGYRRGRDGRPVTGPAAGGASWGAGTASAGVVQTMSTTITPKDYIRSTLIGEVGDIVKNHPYLSFTLIC